MKRLSSLLSFYLVLCIVSTTTAQTTKEQIKLHKLFNKRLTSYIYIPTGSYYTSEAGLPLKSFNSFYMFQTETSNFNWLEFLNDMEDQVSSDSLLQLMPDTSIWKNNISDYYLRHPAYRHYPVVGITYEQIQVYCQWLTDKLNNSNISPFKQVIVRLPYESEWEYAAQAGNAANPFPWKEEGFIDYEHKSYKANFKAIDQSRIQIDSNNTCNITKSTEIHQITTLEELEFTAPCLSYLPNNYGLYNMAGNVSEFVQEKGILKGGSFESTGYYLNLYKHESYNSENYRSNHSGFRIVLQIVEY